MEATFDIMTWTSHTIMTSTHDNVYTMSEEQEHLAALYKQGLLDGRSAFFMTMVRCAI